MFTLSTIYIVFILGTVHPFKEVRLNYNEIASEAVVIFTTDLFFCASDPLTDADRKRDIGYSIMGLIGLSIATSLAKLLMNNFRNIWLYLKRCKNKAQAKNVQAI